MLTSCLQYRLTEAERREFAETGMFIVEQALSAAEVETLLRPAGRIYQQKLGSGHDPRTALFYP
ncbi:MAG TPA: hypothetical protein VGL13_17555, partial [Polyangiaceae bacterium]